MTFFAIPTMILLALAVGGLSAQSNASCPSSPTDSACSTYSLSASNISSSITSLCSQMPGMPGCSLEKLCSNPSVKASLGKYCDSFSILGSICSDMPRMSGCSSYTKMCDPSNNGAGLAPQCSNYPPLKNLPSSLTTTRQIYSICTEMNMDGCDICKISGAQASYSECDLMGTYSKLCIAMPGMKQCTNWSSFCTTSNSSVSSWCATSDSNPNAPPTMKMFFHTGLADYVLFETWVPRSGAQYFASVIFIIVLGICYEFLLMLLAIQEAKWTRDYVQYAKTLEQERNMKRSKGEVSVATVTSPFRIAGIGGYAQGLAGVKVAVARGIFKFFTVGLAYLLMLIAMTFNVGLFFATIAGIALGHILFAPIARAAQLSGSSSSHGTDELETTAQCC